MWNHEEREWRLHQPHFAGAELDPDRAAGPWFGHRWFAYDLIRWGHPETIVELGTHYGVSFFAFCQAVLDEGYAGRLHAVDTWQGDPHAGEYGEDVIEVVRSVRDRAYPDLDITLHRCLFSEALSEFSDGSVDLLHIDGFHTYEAVQEDFETWLPKVAPGGIVLFHDVAPESGYGSATYFAELADRYPSRYFPHSFGLGVLAPKGTEGLAFLFGDEFARWSPYYEARAGAYLGDLVSSTQAGMIDERDDALAVQAGMIDERDALLVTQARTIDEYHSLIAAREAELAEQRAAAVTSLQASPNRGGTLRAAVALLADGARRVGESVRSQDAAGADASTPLARARTGLARAVRRSREIALERVQGTLGRSFDPLFYLVQNADVRAAGIDPLTHYRRFGWREWRDPQPLFWSRWYCQEHTDVAQARVDPFRHYLVHGWREGREPSPLFQSEWYLEQSARARGSGVSPLEHWWSRGYADGEFINREQRRRVVAAPRSDPVPARRVDTCTLFDPSGTSRSVALDDLVDADVDLVTVDLWDTMIARRRPADAPKLATARRMYLAHRGQLPDDATPWSLMELRVDVEAKIAATHDHGEYHVADVLAQVLVEALGLPAETAGDVAASLAADEIAEEVRTTYPVTGLVAFLDRLERRARPPQVAVVSDFYFGEDDLRRVLAGSGFPPSLPVYASCDRLVSKRLDGALFEHVRRELGVEPERHLHVGDNPWSDGQAQVSTGGWAAVIGLNPASHPGPGELDPAHVPDLVDLLARELRTLLPVLVSDGAGDARRVRAAQAGVLTALLPVAVVAAAVEEAVMRGADRVLYASREGAFLARVHDAVAPALCGGHSPRAVHLEVSRRSTFGPSAADLHHDDLLRMWRQYADQSPRALLTSLGLDPEAYRTMVEAAGLDLDVVVSSVADDPRIARLIDDAAFRARAGEALRVNRAALLAYLDDRIAPDGDLVIVDVGWRGTIQDNLALLLPQRLISGVYLGLFPFHNPQPPNVVKRAVAVDGNQGDDFAFVDPPAAVEAPWTPDLPSVVGYRRDADGKVHPVVETEGPRAVPAIDAFQDAAVRAAPTVAEWMVVNGLTTEILREELGRVLLDYYQRPPGGAADIWFDSTHDDTFGVLNDTPYAKRRPPRSILADVGDWRSTPYTPHAPTDEERESHWAAGYRAWLPVEAMEALRQMWGELR